MVIRNICEVNRCKVVKVLYVSVIVIVSFQSKRKEDPFQTTDADLAGFWDMVLLQVADVDRMFNELDELKRHDWNATNVSHTLTVSIARPWFVQSCYCYYLSIFITALLYWQKMSVCLSVCSSRPWYCPRSPVLCQNYEHFVEILPSPDIPIILVLLSSIARVVSDSCLLCPMRTSRRQLAVGAG